ncbi:YkuS family protein [Symbiobacterium thermophilum]|nr:YkuS family protein [Symbiobacterium thermophilum]OTA42065.1 MAG: hypothetical protein A6D92_01775 [Symbiobacterium thermophilum]
MRIAVQDGLENVKQALRAEGYQVTRLTPGSMEGVGAAVVTGLSNNFMGIHDTDGNLFPVIDATGKTVEEIVRQVKERGLH